MNLEDDRLKEAFRAWNEEKSKANQQSAAGHGIGTCPSCGYCPHCGRSAPRYFGPYYQPYYPNYQPYVWMGGGVGSLTSGNITVGAGLTGNPAGYAGGNGNT